MPGAAAFPMELLGRLDPLTNDIDRYLGSRPPRAAAGFEQFMRFADASQPKHRVEGVYS